MDIMDSSFVVLFSRSFAEIPSSPLDDVPPLILLRIWLICYYAVALNPMSFILMYSGLFCLNSASQWLFHSSIIGNKLHVCLVLYFWGYTLLSLFLFPTFLFPVMIPVLLGFFLLLSVILIFFLVSYVFFCNQIFELNYCVFFYPLLHSQLPLRILW